MSYNYGYRGAQRDRDRDRDNDRHYSAISTGGSRRGEEHFARGAGRGYRRQQPYSYTPSGHAGFVVGAVVSDRSASRGPAAAGNAGNYGRARDERSRILAHHEGANPSTPALGADAFLSRYEADHLGEQERDREMEGQDGDVNYDRNDYGFDDGNDGSDDQNIEIRDDMEAGENRVGTKPNANHVHQTNRANNQDQQQQQQQHALAAQLMHAQVISTINANDDGNQRTPRELQAAVHAHVLRRDQPLPLNVDIAEYRNVNIGERIQIDEGQEEEGVDYEDYEDGEQEDEQGGVDGQINVGFASGMAAHGVTDAVPRPEASIDTMDLPTKRRERRRTVKGKLKYVPHETAKKVTAAAAARKTAVDLERTDVVYMRPLPLEHEELEQLEQAESAKQQQKRRKRKNDTDALDAGTSTDLLLTQLDELIRAQKKGKQSSSTSSSQYKGVSQEGRTGRWKAQMKENGQMVRLGSFGTEEHAARAFDLFALKCRGSKAEINFLLEDYTEELAQVTH